MTYLQRRSLPHRSGSEQTFAVFTELAAARRLAH
jgi:hypothetical protein